MSTPLLDMLLARAPGLAGAFARVRADLVAAAGDSLAGNEEQNHSMGLKEHADLSFGLREEAASLADAAGEAVGIGAVSGIDLDANSARMSALQVQKQLAMETLNIVNAAPQALINLLS